MAIRIPRIFLDTSFETNQQIHLPSQLSHYITRVLRLKRHHMLHLFNGQGGYWTAQIVSHDKKNTIVQLLQYALSDHISPLNIHLGQCMSRTKKMDYIIQKATELGVNHITPLFSERSEMKYTASQLEQKRIHWQQVSISASEQCGRNKIPIIEMPISYRLWLQSCQSDLALCLDPTSSNTIPTHHKTPKTVSVVIGPEGGLSSLEIEQALQHQHTTILLGPRILRTETAPVAILSILQYLWGDF
ncbi:MAG: 16S rRNA (uracil(1498)-N(3))-methyltransferase [Endozoicomonadaceae bacterium]|nr:16S rRNA (uracil(1498)-N(3))-methyltransferase [Endozoicomonadaceae bacterium]